MQKSCRSIIWEEYKDSSLIRLNVVSIFLQGALKSQVRSSPYSGWTCSHRRWGEMPCLLEVMFPSSSVDSKSSVQSLEMESRVMTLKIFSLRVGEDGGEEITHSHTNISPLNSEGKTDNYVILWIFGSPHRDTELNVRLNKHCVPDKNKLVVIGKKGKDVRQSKLTCKLIFLSLLMN